MGMYDAPTGVFAGKIGPGQDGPLSRAIAGLLDLVGVNQAAQGMGALNSALQGNFGDALTGAGALAFGLAPMAMGIKGVKPQGIRAYHGSPHDFEKFGLAKIGTGEGAQAYGHGLYFAEAEDVARSYRDALAPKPAMNDPVGNAYDLLKNYGMSKPHLLEELENLAHFSPHDPAKQKFYRDSIEAIRSGAADKYRPPGKMYEVNINADPDAFLNWDKPLSQQPASVRRVAAANDMAAGFERPVASAIGPGGAFLNALSNKQFLYPLDEHVNNFAALHQRTADILRREGVPGVRYLDQDSRIDPAAAQRKIEMYRNNLSSGSAMDAAERASWEARIAELQTELAKPQTSNYVVFDPSIIEILRKYGIVGPIAAPGALMPFTGGEPQL